MVVSFRDLEVWQKAMDLVVLVYTHTAGFPREERFGLTQQLRDAAVSVPSDSPWCHRIARSVPCGIAAFIRLTASSHGYAPVSG